MMYAPYGPYFAYIEELLPARVSGASMALVNSFGALGGFVGAYIVGYMVSTPGGTAHAFIFMAIALALAGILMLPTSRIRSKSTAQPGTGSRPLHSHTKAG